MGLFGHVSKGASSSTAATTSIKKAPQYVFIDSDKEPEREERPKSRDISNDNIDLLTSKMTSYRKSRRRSSRSRRASKSSRESREPKSVATKSVATRSVATKSVATRSVATKSVATRSTNDHTTVVASNSRRQARSIDRLESRSRIPRTISAPSTSPTSRRHRSAEPSLRKERTSFGSDSQRKSRSTAPKSILTSPKNPPRSKSAEPSTTPRSMKTITIGSGSQRKSRSISKSVRIESPRSKSADPSMRQSRSVDLGVASTMTRSKSAEPDQSLRKSRSADIGIKTNLKSSRSRSAEPFKKRLSRFSRSLSPSNSSRNTINTLKTDESQIQQSPSEVTKTPSSTPKQHTTSPRTPSNLIEVVPFRLGKDMTYLADGMNIDRNTRFLLAAFDSRTLDDFYLMSDHDFSVLVQKAKKTKHPLPPLQIRKVQMLRTWIKEVVDDHINDNDDENSGVRRKLSLMPKDWKEQYKNDLPHLKLQLRQQSDSFLQRIKNFSETFACGAASIY